MKNWTINTLLLLLFWLHSLCYKGTKTPVSHAALSPTRLWRSTYGQIFTTTKKTQLTQQCKQQKVIRIKCEPCKNIYRLYFTRRDCSLPKGLGKLLPSEPPAAAWPDLYVASAKTWMQDSVVGHFCCFEDIQQHYFLSFQLCFLFFFSCYFILYNSLLFCPMLLKQMLELTAQKLSRQLRFQNTSRVCSHIVSNTATIEWETKNFATPESHALQQTVLECSMLSAFADAFVRAKHIEKEGCGPLLILHPQVCQKQQPDTQPPTADFVKREEQEVQLFLFVSLAEIKIREGSDTERPHYNSAQECHHTLPITSLTSDILFLSQCYRGSWCIIRKAITKSEI